MTEPKIVRLTADEVAAFEGNAACLDACHEVVTQAIKHWEGGKIELQAIWRALSAKYEFSLHRMRATYRPDDQGGFLEVRDIIDAEVKDIIEKEKKTSGVFQYFKDKFGTMTQ